MTTNDETPIDYRQLGTSFDELVAPFVESWTPEVRQFGEDLSARFYFQSRLHELRKALGLSQAAAGELVGEAQSEISRMERGEVVPSVNRGVRIIVALQARAASLDDTHDLPVATAAPGKVLRAIEVARYLLVHQDQEDEISNLKLQKLLYFAQGTFLATFNRPLFSDPLIAWQHGPVAPAVWRTYFGSGSASLPHPTDFDESTIEAETRALLDGVYQEWGGFSAWKLRNITHAEGPWLTTPAKGVIDQQAITDYFVSLQERSRRQVG